MAINIIKAYSELSLETEMALAKTLSAMTNAIRKNQLRWDKWWDQLFSDPKDALLFLQDLSSIKNFRISDCIYESFIDWDGSGIEHFDSARELADLLMPDESDSFWSLFDEEWNKKGALL